MTGRRVPRAFSSASEAHPHAPVIAAPAGTPRDEHEGGPPDPHQDQHRAPHQDQHRSDHRDPQPGIGDPLRLCVATTVALISWVLTPPVAVVVFAALAIVTYTRARRAGLLRSRCALGDTRLVLAYLALALVAGVIGTVVLHS